MLKFVKESLPIHLSSCHSPLAVLTIICLLNTMKTLGQCRQIQWQTKKPYAPLLLKYLPTSKALHEKAVAAENCCLLPCLQCGGVIRASLKTTGKLICSDDTSPYIFRTSVTVLHGRICLNVLEAVSGKVFKWLKNHKLANCSILDIRSLYIIYPTLPNCFWLPIKKGGYKTNT